ncbi:DUF1631 domain-containing protein [Calidifontimicrobium sp. SYSU G02091]|uniref:DUF1631 family protein n=1 Tax=Calidifontimicrobium sp. SYSU G02091 TaxID=2926421 RepID=UPI001F52BC10|nr:DUF1631 family protein [Calidifontimicrobium sp. SYSU G02091]MCI1190859.1 DUF1631 domain-containing protein [Calidifontimicrobium sp. SYSU G02091]
MPAAASIQQFVDDELRRCPELAERVHAGTLHALKDPERAALYPSERPHHFALLEALSARAAPFREAFCDALRRRVASEMRPARDAAAPARGGTLELELVDESRVEVDIEISRAAQVIDSTAEWELRELQTFTSALAGLRHVSAHSLPLRPHAYAGALWDATGAVLANQAQRIVLLRAASAVLADELKRSFAQATARLEAQGVMPSAYRSIKLPPGSVPAAGRGATAVTGALQALLGETSLSRAAIGAPGGTVASPVQAAQIAALVSRLFRAFATDDRVGADARDVIAALQDPVLRLVLADESALHDLDHPVWQLLDRIARIGEDYAPGDARQRRLLAACTPLAAQLAAADVPTAAMVRRALAAIDAETDALWQERLAAAQPAIAQLARVEQREVLQHRLAERLTEQMAARSVPPAVRRFLAGPWARVIAQAMVEHGEAHARTQAFVRAVDDLLWSLDVPPEPASRQKLLALLPPLLGTLRSGMASIALPDAERDAVLDQLMAAHTEALRGRAAGDARTPGAADVMQRLRDELRAGEPPARPFGDSVIDVASMETVPAEFLPTGVDDGGAPADTFAVGQMRRMFVGGRWTRVQLLWRSERGQYLLLADDADARTTHSMTRRALERLQAARLVQPLPPSSLVRRTIEKLTTQVSLQ